MLTSLDIAVIEHNTLRIEDTNIFLAKKYYIFTISMLLTATFEVLICERHTTGLFSKPQSFRLRTIIFTHIHLLLFRFPVPRWRPVPIPPLPPPHQSLERRKEKFVGSFLPSSEGRGRRRRRLGKRGETRRAKRGGSVSRPVTMTNGLIWGRRKGERRLRRRVCVGLPYSPSERDWVTCTHHSTWYRRRRRRRRRKPTPLPPSPPSPTQSRQEHNMKGEKKENTGEKKGIRLPRHRTETTTRSIRMIKLWFFKTNSNAQWKRGFSFMFFLHPNP